MKNKEIEELLNELKEATNSKKLSSTYCITNKHWQLLLSYIEQLEKRNESLLEDRKQLLNLVEQLENNRDKAIEYNEHLIEHAKYHLNLGHLKKMRKILKGDSDD